ncbi:Crp/Fnr family transcriptional regulator [Bradyrhizobium sp. WSM 1738]|uniref:Crp/Fnr family transcriptional regulator n=1 Tax=Bradyrhizobium hereditatis TaxID=2821405 RepID=UPI001CE396CE|nr:Crp/Fnr family transcriptional regulator [Bradyrhizobium hereditatis]MCA6115437.1 Crp/Fnr family transcriptional regulator [Bradyrhizobium hereditatis]
MHALPDIHASDRMLSPKWSIATEGLSAAQRQMILDRMKAVSFDPKDILFDQGEPSDTLLLVTEGRVRLFQTIENGEEFTFGICLPGTILGLAATVTGQPRILSAEALEAATASVMTRPDFLRCLSEFPPFHWNITRLLAILSIESIERSGPMALDRASVRLGTILKSLARPEQGDATQSLSVVGLSQQELARMIGVSRSWVAIALAEFERLGLISKSRGKIVIRNARRLDGFIAEERNH